MSHPVSNSVEPTATTPENGDPRPTPAPGSIQAHGVLLALRPDDLTILQVSENSADWLGASPDQLLGQRLEKVLAPPRMAALREALDRDPVERGSFHVFTLPAGEVRNREPLQASVHTVEGVVILELERDSGEIEADFYALLRRSLARFQSCAHVNELARALTDEVRRESGMDRVAVCLFHADASAEVIAESKREGLNSRLGWRYPADDLPPSARDILKKIWSRTVPDIQGKLAGIVPRLHPDTQRPLDLTYGVLRGPSRRSTEYLANMGVGAVLTLPLRIDGELWGLVACHHDSARPISHRVRAAAEFLARAASQQLQLLEEREAAAYRSSLEKAHFALLAKMSVEPDLAAFTRGEPNLLTSLDAGGAALFYHGHWHTVGRCPTEAQLEELSRWIDSRPEFDSSDRPVFATDSLAAQFPNAIDYAGPASGLLAIRFDRDPLGLILWFRPETPRTFNWAGNPNELPPDSGRHGPRATPRKSFELWREEVNHRALPWKKVEIEGALKLRALIVDLVVSRGTQLETLRRALSLTRARFDISLDAAQLGAWELDLATRKLWRTPRHDLIFGYDQMLPAWEFPRFVHHIVPSDRRDVLPRMEEALAARKSFDLEMRIKDARGALRWLWIYGTPIAQDGRDTFVGLVGDITARKASEQIAQSQSSLRILRSAMALSLATGTQENETLGAWAQLLATHLEQSAVLVWFADETGELKLRAIAGAFAGIRAEDFNLEEMTREAGPIIVSSRSPDRTVPGSVRAAGFSSLATFAIHGEGRVLGLIALCLRTPVSLNMSDEIRTMIEGVAQWIKRRSVERALAESSERARLAVEATNLGSWDFFPKSGLLLWSARCKELFGLPADARVDYSVFLAGLHPDDRERADRAVQRALDPAGDGSFDHEFRTIGLEDGGVERWIRSTGQAYFDDDRSVNRFIGTVQDITETVRAREVMATRGQELQALVEARTSELTATVGELEAFSYSISHDMRSPLRAMQGFSQALLEDYGDKLDATALDYLQRIDRGSRRLDLLIQDVLTYSRVAQGEIAMHAVELEPLLREMIQNHEEFAEPRATVRLELAAPRVLAHEAFLSQIFSNLLGNAVKFQFHGARPAVTVRSEEFGEGHVRVWICDNGIGIDPAHFQRIFRIFGRVHAEKSYEGTGIGLAIVKKAVARMSGEIGLESEPGHGTRFWFTLRKAP